MAGISKRLPWVCQQAVIDVAGHYVMLQGMLGQEELIIVGLYTHY